MKNSCMKSSFVEPSIHLICLNVTFCITCIISAMKEQCTFCETHIQLQISGDCSAFVRAGALFSLDLWWLQGVGRSSCDYCLHTDLYLTFNYLRGLQFADANTSLLLGPVGGNGGLSGFHPTHSLCRWCQRETGDTLHLLAAAHSSPRAEHGAVPDIPSHCGI